MSINQGALESVLRGIFPTLTFVPNARKPASLTNPLTGGYLEVDIWIPEINLAFEYQDDYHYRASWYSHYPLHVIQGRDETKRRKLLEKGETLVVIPCWWDGKSESLKNTIYFHRPDVFTNKESEGELIPSNSPLNFFPSATLDHSQLMLALFPTPLYMNDMMTRPWWLGEKYDGVRCVWQPGDQALYSRQKVSIEIHPLVKKWFPSQIVLDGEIWFGRSFFVEAQGLTSSSEDRVHWPMFRILCFDEASAHKRSQIFEDRYSVILSQISAVNPVIIAAPRVSCDSTISLIENLKHILEGGGEGVILQEPQSPYIPGRSQSLFKLKASHSDAEALVVEVQEDGSLTLQMPNNTLFTVPKESCLLPTEVKRGDIVTFTYDYSQREPRHHDAADPPSENPQSTTSHFVQDIGRRWMINEVPSNPAVTRIRTDLSWEDLVHSSTSPVRSFRNEIYQNVENAAPKPRAIWKHENLRKILESLARRDNFDPLHPEHWYKHSVDFARRHKQIRSILDHFDSSISKALVALFPELNLDITKFSKLPRSYWSSAQNRRVALEQYAYRQGSNPLSSDFWYNLTSKQLLNAKGMHAILWYYSGYIDAVVHLFPEIKFDRTKFVTNTPWVEESNRRKFFDNFAVAKGFDPLNPKAWSTVSTLEVIKYNSGYKSIAMYHGGKLLAALMDLYPDIGLKKLHVTNKAAKKNVQTASS